MQLTSSQFTDGTSIPPKFTCEGDNINPPLEWSGALENVHTYVLIVDDPDAPKGTFVHWLLWNIPGNVNKIEEDSFPPEAVQGKNSALSIQYIGPCPPEGTHRYFFKLYALDTVLEITPGSEIGVLEEAMQKHIIAEAELVGLYCKNKQKNGEV